jgi:hypothetical protein
MIARCQQVRKTMKNTYLWMSVVGTVVPLVLFAEHFASAGPGWGDLVHAMFANAAASGIAADVVISSLVFWVMVRLQGPQGPSPWPFLFLNCVVGLSCAMPAYLYACARRDELRLATAH